MSKENYAPWDSAEFLNDDKAIMEYLRAALEENDLKFFMKAFDNAIRARDMNQERIESSWLAPTLSTSAYEQDHTINSGQGATVLIQDSASLTGIPTIPFSDSLEFEDLMAMEGK